MWTKIKAAMAAVAGVLVTVATLLFIALLGLFIAFVGYFFLWGIIGLALFSFIAFLIWAAVVEYCS